LFVPVEPQYESLTFQNGPVRIQAVAKGPANGPLLILLHGFPEFWYGWRHQISPLAEVGFRVVVPDQRGYNRSSKPQGLKNYQLSCLTDDVLAIADQLGHQRFLLAGHDWGAMVAWHTAITHPDRVARLAILNVPHPAVIKRALKRRPQQLLRSWYMFFFQIPWLPEFLIRFADFQSSKKSLVQSSRPGAFSPEDLEYYAKAWSQLGALTGMVNWYRALLRYPPKVDHGRVTVPTRILWGVHDSFLLPVLARESVRYCSQGELITFENATHWLQHEEPERVSELLKSFFLEAI
jgi:epoxide hydrolase 4